MRPRGAVGEPRIVRAGSIRAKAPSRGLLALAALLAAAGPAPGRVPFQDPGADAEPPPLALRVNAAISRGVAHLRATQRAGGSWPEEERYPGGMTALATYALVKSGVRRSAGEVVRGVRHLAETPTASTYDCAVRVLLYESLGQPEVHLDRARACVAFLLDGQREGLWAYPWGQPDMSNVQFALFALRSASHMGVEIPAEPLEECARAIWRLHDDDGGGFRYHDGRMPTAGITAATLAGICVLEELGATHRGVRLALDGRRKDRAKAHAWLTEVWDPARNVVGRDAWTPSFHYAYLWAVERYGDLSGQRLLGEADWYDEGAEWLVADQNDDGSWGDRLEQTCFALLFLRRAVLSGGPALDELEARLGGYERAPKPRPPVIDADAPYLVDWLVAGPFQGEPGATGLFDPPFAPERLRVRERGRVGKRRWERLELARGSWTNLEETTGRPADHALWALATRIRWPADPRKGDAPPPLAACLWFDFEDGWRVFLDGVEVSSGRRVGAGLKLDVRVPFELTAGELELVVLSEDVVGSAAFGARLSAADGSALPTGPRGVAVGVD